MEIITNIAPGRLTQSKMICIKELVDSKLFKMPECRQILLPVFCQQIKDKLESKEEVRSIPFIGFKHRINRLQCHNLTMCSHLNNCVCVCVSDCIWLEKNSVCFFYRFAVTLFYSCMKSTLWTLSMRPFLLVSNDLFTGRTFNWMHTFFCTMSFARHLNRSKIVCHFGDSYMFDRCFISFHFRGKYFANIIHITPLPFIKFDLFTRLYCLSIQWHFHNLTHLIPTWASSFRLIQTFFLVIKLDCTHLDAPFVLIRFVCCIACIVMLFYVVLCYVMHSS